MALQCHQFFVVPVFFTLEVLLASKSQSPRDLYDPTSCQFDSLIHYFNAGMATNTATFRSSAGYAVLVVSVAAFTVCLISTLLLEIL